jgi:hypothetical protein
MERVTGPYLNVNFFILAGRISFAAAANLKYILQLTELLSLTKLLQAGLQTAVVRPSGIFPI